MKYYDAKDLVDLIAGKYKNDESILNSKETLEQLNRQEDNIYYYRKSYVAYQNILNTYADLVKEIRLQNLYKYVCYLLIYYGMVILQKKEAIYLPIIELLL